MDTLRIGIGVRCLLWRILSIAGALLGTGVTEERVIGGIQETRLKICTRHNKVLDLIRRYRRAKGGL